MRIKKIAVSAFMCFVIAAACAIAQDGTAAQPAPAQPAPTQQAVQPAPAQPAPAQQAVVQPAPAQQAAAQQAPAPAAAAVNTEEIVIANIPATSYWGVRGLSQTVSAEPLGFGRLNVAVLGSYFQQDKCSGDCPDDWPVTSPEEDADVVLGRVAIAWGINNSVDVFAVFPWNYTIKTKFTMPSEIVVGGKFALPLPEESPFKFAVQPQLIWGLTSLDNVEKGNVFTTLNSEYPYGGNDTADNSYAGYDFFDTRGSIDIVVKLVESIVLNGQSKRRAIKIHFNEGISYATGKDDEWLGLLAVGLEIDPIEFLTIGVETNWRTLVRKPNFYNDPFWLTPSIMYRSPWCFGFLGGVDINLSTTKGKDKSTRPLEQWRAFADVVLSFDTFASKREAAARRAREEAAEKARLEAETQRLTAEKEGLAQKALEDSVRATAEMARRAEADSLRAKSVADSLANLVSTISEKARQDSITQAESAKQLLANAEAKRVADSLALADAQKKLSEEKAKRTEAEQYLLTTGMLVLDAVYFTSGKTDLHINSRPYLGTIAKMLAKYPKLKIEIGGHTDNIGGFETNMNLSRKRAEAVFLQMVNTEPSLAQMLTSRGYGSTVPKADNKTAGGRELNRRVELKVLNPEVLKDYNP